MDPSRSAPAAALMLARVVIFAMMAWALCGVGHRLSTAGVFPIFWPTSGFLVVSFMLTSKRNMVPTAVGSTAGIFIAELQNHPSFIAAFALTAIYLGEAIAAALILTRLRESAPAASSRTQVALGAIPGVVIPAISASLIMWADAALRATPTTTPTWSNLFLSHALGILAVAPPVELTVLRLRRRSHFTRPTVLRMLIWIVGIAVLLIGAAVAFHVGGGDAGWGFLLIPPLALISLLGEEESGWAVAAVVVGAIAGLMRIEGESRSTAMRYVLELQSFMLVIGATMFFLAAAGHDARTATRRAEREEIALRNLSLRLADSQERIRRRLGTWVHDEVAQPLVAVKLNISMAEAEAGAPSDALSNAKTLVHVTLAEVRTMLAHLTPSGLEELGLGAAIEQNLCDVAPADGPVITVRVDPAAEDTDASVRLILYRAAFEGAMNAFEHAECSQVRIECECSDNWVTLSVSDDGKGLADGHLLGSGLVLIREWARRAGGSLELQALGVGSRLRLSLPCRLSDDKLVIPHSDAVELADLQRARL